MLTTPRLICEPLVAGHAPLLFPELQNTVLYRFIPQDPPVDIATLTTRYERLAREPHSPDGDELWLNWALREKSDDGIYVGTLQASVTPGQIAYIAYFIFEPHQRQGYAREAVGALVEYLFEDHQVEIVAAEIDTRNAPSIALITALGFQCVAHTANADFFKGAPSDEYRFELCRD